MTPARIAGKSEVACSARVAISSRLRPRTRTPSASSQLARHLDQRQAAPLAGRLGEREAAGVVAVQERRLDRGPPGLGGVEAAGADMRPGLRLGIARRGRVDQRGAGGVEADPAG